MTVPKRSTWPVKPALVDPPFVFTLGTLAGRFTSDDDLIEPVFTAEEWAENDREWDELNAPDGASHRCKRRR